MSERSQAALPTKVVDSLCELAELDDNDPIFNRNLVKTRVEHAIESYQWHERQVGASDPVVPRLKGVVRLCEQLGIAIRELPPEDLEFAFQDSETPQLNFNFLGELFLLQDKLETIVGIRQPPRSTGGRPRRSDSRAFVEHLVETFYLVDGGQRSGRGCTKYRRLLDFLTICIEEAGVQGAPAILQVKDSAWKKYVAPAITSTRVSLPQSRKLYEGLHRVSVRQEGAVAP